MYVFDTFNVNKNATVNKEEFGTTWKTTSEKRIVTTKRLTNILEV